MPTFLVLSDCEPSAFVNADGDHGRSDAEKLAYNAHRYVHEHLGNQASGAAVVTNEGLHNRLEAAWNEEPVPVYAVVVHPRDATSYAANVYADKARAEATRAKLRSERQGIDVAIEEYGVDASLRSYLCPDALPSLTGSHEHV
jgi:hypothetical protein